MITTPTTLETDHLILRPLAYSDAGRIRELAGDYDIAAMTLNTPHPYPEGAAQTFIQNSHEALADGSGYTFAIVRRGESSLIGCIGLHLARQHSRAEMGYWTGKPYWNMGYTSEAAQRMVQFGFESLELNRIYAACFAGNYASARVMQKAGMSYEGTMRHHFYRMGKFEDGVYYGILREDWLAAQSR